MEAWIDEAEDRGRKEGENRMGQLINVLLRDGKSDELQKVATDESRRMELYRQRGIN